MEYKKTIILLALVVFLLSIAGVSASEIDNTIASENANTIELSTDNDIIEDNLQTSEENMVFTSTDYDEALSAQTDTEVLGEGSAKYSDLDEEIGHSGDITLTHKNYTYDEGAPAITISEANKVIDGNGAVIDMNGSTIGAFYISASGVTIKNLTIKNANYNGDGGAIYFTSSGTVSNCNFTDNKATGTHSCGGAIWMSSGSVENCNFTDNQATYYGGAVYFVGTGNVTNCNFDNNTVGVGGGAIWMSSGSVENCNFTANHAATGSAIFFYGTSATKTVSNSRFLNNRANAETLEVIKNDNNITITFTGQNNLLNAIYSMYNAEVTFNNVTYWGKNGITTISTTKSGFNNEEGQNITVGVVVNDKLVLSEVMVTDENGQIVLDIITGNNYYIGVRHDTDSYYTSDSRTISNNTKFNVNVTSQTTTNRTVNITAKSNIPNEIIKGKLLFILPNSEEISANYGGNGTWWAVHKFDDYGVYEVNASYTGLDNVTVNNGTITINKPDSTIMLDDITLNYGESKNVTVTTTGATEITASINGTDVTVINNYTIPISGLAAGNYTLNVTTVPDGDHNSVSKEVKIIVYKATAEITVDSATMDIKVLDEVLSGATLTPADAGNLTYKSNNETVVIVKDGKIKALAKGTATITVSFAGNENYTATKNKTISVTVTLKDAIISVNNSTLNLFVDDNFTVVASTNPDGLNVTYIVDDSGVVSVSDDGVVTALKCGKAVITVKIAPNGVYAENSTTVAVSVNKLPSEIKINSPTGEMSVGAMGHVAAELNPSEAGKLTYVSNDTSVVNVSSTGVIKANKVGTALITVSFAGNDIYAPAENKTITITVNLNDASVSVENSTLNLKFNDTFDIVATTSPTGLAVNYTSSNETVVTVDAKGRITVVGTGRAVVTVSVGGDGVYALNSTTVDVVVKKELNLNATAFAVGNMTLIVTGLENATGNVSITVDGKNYTSSIMMGMAFVSLPKLDENVTAYVYYPGDENYYAASTTVDIVVKHGLNISVAADPIYVGEDAVVVVSGLENATGNVSMIAGRNIFNATIINGIATATISGLNNNTTVIVFYMGDNNYKMAFNITNITVLAKENLTITASAKAIYVGDKATVVVSGLENATGNVTVRADNKTYSGIIVDGTAKVVISGLTKNTIAYVDYGGDRRYNPSNTAVNITVNKIKTKLTAKTVTTVYNVNKNLVITLKDSKGNPISGVKISVNLGKSRTVTIKNGQAKVSTKGLVPKKYTAKITFNGNTKYAKSTKSVKVTVKKATPKLTAKKKTFKKSVKTKKYSVVLKTNKNKVMKKVKLTIKVNKKTYSAKTNSKGKATFKITKLTKKGKYAALVKYKGSKYYNAKSVKVKITVK